MNDCERANQSRFPRYVREYLTMLLVHDEERFGYEIDLYEMDYPEKDSPERVLELYKESLEPRAKEEEEE